MASALELVERLSIPSATFDAQWYDPVLQQLVLRRGAAFQRISVVSETPQLSAPLVLSPEACAAVYVAFSLDGSYVAVQVSPSELLVFSFAHSGRFEQRWRIDTRTLGLSTLSKLKGDVGSADATEHAVMLSEGIVWSDHGGTSQDLILVTRRGLEFFKVNAKKNLCKHYRSVQHATTAFWYAPASRLMVMATGPKGNTMCSYFMPYDTSDLPKLEIPPPHAAPVFELGLHGASSLQSREVGLLSLYRFDYCLQLVPGASKASTPLAYLYRIDRERVSLTHMLVLGAPGDPAASPKSNPSAFRAGMSFSVVDNMLVLHSAGAKESVVFDVASHNADAMQEKHSDEYISPALVEQRRLRTRYPRVMAPIVEAGPLCLQTGQAEGEREYSYPAGPYTDSWPLHAPCWVSRSIGSRGASGEATQLFFEIRMEPQRILGDGSACLPAVRTLLRRGIPAKAPVAASQMELQRIRSVSNGIRWRLLAAGASAAQRRGRVLMDTLVPHQRLKSPFEIVYSVKCAILDKLQAVVARFESVDHLRAVFAALAAAEAAALGARSVVLYGLQSLREGTTQGKAQSAQFARGPDERALPEECTQLSELLENGTARDEEMKVLGAVDDTVAYSAPWLPSSSSGFVLDRSSLTLVCAQALSAARSGSLEGSRASGWGLGAGCYRKAHVDSRLPLRNLRAPDGRLIVFHNEIVFHVLLPAAIEVLVKWKGGAPDESSSKREASTEHVQQLQYIVDACLELCAAQSGAATACELLDPGAVPHKGTKPPSAAVVVVAGECLLCLGKPKEVVRLFRSAPCEDSLSLAAYLLRRGDVERGQLREMAIQMLERIGDLGSLVHGLLSLGRVRQAMEACRRHEKFAASSPRPLPASPGEWFQATVIRAETLPPGREADRAAIFYSLYAFLEEWDRDLLIAKSGERASSVATSYGKPFPKHMFSSRTASTLMPLFGFAVDEVLADSS